MWRGAAPVQRALIAGDGETGTNVVQLTAGLDEGDVYGGTRYRIPATATAGRVLEDLAPDGAAPARSAAERTNMLMRASIASRA